MCACLYSFLHARGQFQADIADEGAERFVRMRLLLCTEAVDHTCVLLATNAKPWDQGIGYTMCHA